MNEFKSSKLNINTMKIVKNTSLQGLSISFKTPEGIKSIFLSPKSQCDVPDSWTSKVLLNLVKRRMAKVINVVDTPKPVEPVSEVNPTRKYTRKESS